ncbi:carboxylesterase family protein, partial [Phenylobacterium sp.]|uniref:carboxylesterase family protein n=1 Tax=Phenylobacterium sp. TaxID=1871053 RepID=UPI002FD9E40B
MQGWTGALAGLALIFLAPGAQAQAPEAAARLQVTVETGRLEGEATDRAVIFRNIPYAAPPVGALRWAPPAPAAPWTGVRQAVAAGPSCPQPMRADGAPNDGGANGPMSEDCLQLNVYAPLGAPKDAPVMVWIHGG